MSALALAPSELTRSPESQFEMFVMSPGAVLVPYDGTNTSDGSLTDFQRLLCLKADLEDRGIMCTLDIQRTEPVYTVVPQPPRKPEDPAPKDTRPDYRLAQPPRHFALFVLDGVGEPQQEIRQRLVQADGLFAGETIGIGGDFLLPNSFTSGASGRPNLDSCERPDPTELIELLTGFTQKFTAAQHSQWRRLRDELEVANSHLNYLRTARGITFSDVEAQRQAIKAKNAEIRAFLASAISPMERRSRVSRFVSSVLNIAL